MPDDAPDVYADSFQVVSNAYGSTLIFGRRAPGVGQPGQPPPIETQVVVRISLQQAKTITMVMRRHLKEFERENIEIGIPPKLYNELKLSPEDWDTLT